MRPYRRSRTPEAATLPYGRGTQTRISPRVNMAQRRALSRSNHPRKQRTEIQNHSNIDAQHHLQFEAHTGYARFT